jgi:hypothetical protein
MSRAMGRNQRRSEKAWPKSERPNGEHGTKVLRLAKETASRRIRGYGIGVFSRCSQDVLIVQADTKGTCVGFCDAVLLTPLHRLSTGILERGRGRGGLPSGITFGRVPRYPSEIDPPPRLRSRVSSHKFFSRPTNNRSILAFLASHRSAQARQYAVLCAINLPPAPRSHARGTFAAQIPIAEHAARPTERISRDFVPWRFSDAGRRSARLDRCCRRPKTCTAADIVRCSKKSSLTRSLRRRWRAASQESRCRSFWPSAN